MSTNSFLCRLNNNTQHNIHLLQATLHPSICLSGMLPFTILILNTPSKIATFSTISETYHNRKECRMYPQTIPEMHFLRQIDKQCWPSLALLPTVQPQEALHVQHPPNDCT
jgi:hypothetical protein